MMKSSGIKRVKRPAGIEKLKRRYGYLFVSPWIIGLLLFFVTPLLSSIVYSLSDARMGQNGVETTFAGLKHYKSLLFEDPEFINKVVESIFNAFSSLPIILALSMSLGIVLNQPFKGRSFARAIFFLPVIISASVVMVNMGVATDTIGNPFTQTEAPKSEYIQLIDFSSILRNLNFPQAINDISSDYLTNAFNLLWSCGIQILLFIAGLQTIPNHLYEVAQVEGANPWESFWYITVPMLGRVIFLVLVFTMIESFLTFGSVPEEALMDMTWYSKFDKPSASLWMYFIVVGLIMSVILLLYNRFCLKKWGD